MLAFRTLKRQNQNPPIRTLPMCRACKRLTRREGLWSRDERRSRSCNSGERRRMGHMPLSRRGIIENQETFGLLTRCPLTLSVQDNNSGLAICSGCALRLDSGPCINKLHLWVARLFLPGQCRFQGPHVLELPLPGQVFGHCDTPRVATRHDLVGLRRWGERRGEFPYLRLSADH